LQNDRSIEDQISVCEKFAAKNGWSVEWNFYDRAASGADQSGHKSIDTLRGYVRDAELFKDHAEAGLL
jgi:hypothetical protein